jgi:phosphatidylinositol-3-phosphatase
MGRAASRNEEIDPVRQTRPIVLLIALVLAAVTPLTSPPPASAALPAEVRARSTVPGIRHVFVVNLENKGFRNTFGPSSKAPYLSRTLRQRGALLSQYYGTAHHSLPNYIAQISGQAPNTHTQGDCRLYTRFTGAGSVAPGQAVGQGCVYPARVRTVADQLAAKHLSWRGYMEDMGRGCRHPALGSRDTTHKARKGDQYAARHNPFVYFASLTSKASCAQRDVSLSHLAKDLQSVRTTRNLSYISPNLCNDGHDAPCVDGRPGGLVSANRWLRRWVPRILDSPAFRRDGLLVVTFDEAGSGDASACCGDQAGPNSARPGITGPGGGRVGAVLVSRFITPGTTSTRPYNHYSLLRTIEDVFGLGHLGYAQTSQSFGSDVFGG